MGSAPVPTTAPVVISAVSDEVVGPAERAITEVEVVQLVVKQRSSKPIAAVLEGFVSAKFNPITESELAPDLAIFSISCDSKLASKVNCWDDVPTMEETVNVTSAALPNAASGTHSKDVLDCQLSVRQRRSDKLRDGERFSSMKSRPCTVTEIPPEGGVLTGKAYEPIGASNETTPSAVPTMDPRV
jgi:hypothetical protein